MVKIFSIEIIIPHTVHVTQKKHSIFIYGPLGRNQFSIKKMDIKGIGAIRVTPRRHCPGAFSRELAVRSAPYHQLTGTRGWILRARGGLVISGLASPTIVWRRRLREQASQAAVPRGCGVLRPRLGVAESIITEKCPPFGYKYIDVVAQQFTASSGGLATASAAAPPNSALLPRRDCIATPPEAVPPVSRIREKTRLSTSIICLSSSESFLGLISAVVKNKLHGVSRGFLVYIRVRQEVVPRTQRANSSSAPAG